MFSSNTTQVSDGGYQISRSLRFNSADTTYLGRTPSTAGNRQIFTWSGWVKRSALTLANTLFGARNVGSNPYADFYFSNTNVFTCDFGPDASRVTGGTTAVFRDTSAWYHVVVAVDTTQATDTNRVKVYINNQLFTLSAYPAQNLSTDVNNTVAHQMGRRDGGDQFLNGYMTEVNFIDGQQLTPSSFGETNADTGVWQPKAYSGSYGTNGFELNFSDNSNTTAATLGKDYSGNGNNWTPNNFSVTAGAGNDSLVDSPTSYGTDTGVGGTVRGNYATFNPLVKLGTVPLVNGNLDTTSTASSNSTQSTIAVSSGKWYVEFVPSSRIYPRIGVQDITETNSNMAGSVTIAWGGGNELFINGSSVGAYGQEYVGGDVIGVAVDVDTRKVWFSKNGTWINFTGSGADPATGTNPVGTLAGTNAIAYAVRSESCTVTANFGQRPFSYTAPSGFKALCTQNLPVPTIGATTATQAGNYFNTALWTGDNTTNRNIAVGFEPDLVWTKGRNSASWSHFWQDRLRGFVNFIQSPSTAAETTTTPNIVSGTYSSGFTIQNNGNSNNSGSTYVAWNWKANGSGSTNTAGSITSTVSANTTSGFSVLTYTGNGSNATVGHGIGIAPSMVIVKQRNTTRSWIVYNSNIGATKYLVLDSTGAAGTYAFFWNDTAPTSSVFSIGTDGAVNTSAGTYVAYCFAPIAGYSAFGSYTGNGSADGPFVFTGMRPAYVMVKRTDTTDQWTVYDSARNTSNLTNRILYPNLANAEDVGTDGIDMLSNGIKMRNTYSNLNASGGTYIYMAFASNPFKYSLAR